MIDEPQTPHRLVFVTGPSGAGRSTASNALEDLGFEAIDNIPLSLVPRLLDGAPLNRPTALAIDARNRDFTTTAMIELIERLTRAPEVELVLLYLDCDTDALMRRYAETRRRHPLAPGETPEEGIGREIDLLQPVRARADVVIDTTGMSPHDLRAEIERWFEPGAEGRMAISVQSFSYKRGLPRGLDMVFDCRFLRNPHWEESLRALDGRDPRVARYVANDRFFERFYVQVRDLVEFILPAQVEEGKAHLAIGFGCTGGRHRSVVLAEKLARSLADSGWRVSKRHKELDRAARRPRGGFTGDHT
ncbi:RNase adapter RapZ [Rhodobacteraceae bacterium WD3A24]|nr:RNase adapter RapZ [Rhodobacteraceae bacterium WD3A24]